ncbi:metal ABC transporter substrate-binding protein [Pontimonas sp.]|nr:metal ABC transporter substrate-binding protein [Pontimonas sp.]
MSTTVLGGVVSDIARCAEGDDQAVTVVMPAGVDPHDFQPSSAHVASMVAADLVIVNGLGLEEGLLPALDSIGSDGARVLEMGALIDPLPFGAEAEEHSEDEHHDDHADEDHSESGAEEDDHADEDHSESGAEEDDHADEDHSESGAEEDDHAHGAYDPHFWMDMDRMAAAARFIGEEVETFGAEGYSACGEEVAASIEAAEQELLDTLAGVPDARRILVTDHDALSYFAESYGFRVIGVVIPGGSTLGEPNSQELAALVSVIQDQDVPAIFGDATLSNEILEILAAEAGRDVQVVSLFIGSLGGPDSGATSYEEMMMTNADRIAQALAR